MWQTVMGVTESKTSPSLRHFNFSKQLKKTTEMIFQNESYRLNFQEMDNHDNFPKHAKERTFCELFISPQNIFAPLGIIT